MGSAGPFCWFAGYPHDGGPLVARLGGGRKPCLRVCWLGRQTSSRGSCIPKAAKEKEGTRASVSLCFSCLLMPRSLKATTLPAWSKCERGLDQAVVTRLDVLGVLTERVVRGCHACHQWKEPLWFLQMMTDSDF